MREGSKWILSINLIDRKELAEAIKDAFEEGWNSYETPCVPYNSLGDAWSSSDAKISHDRLIQAEEKSDG